MEKAIKAKIKKSYVCTPDAEAALALFTSKHSDEHFLLTCRFKSEENRGPGRPGKNCIIQKLYRQELGVSVNKETLERTRERLSCFVLITNLDQSCTAHDLLKQHKAQSKTEISLKILKDPIFVGPVFLKKPSRVQALAYVLLIALLILNIWRWLYHDYRWHELLRFWVLNVC